MQMHANRVALFEWTCLYQSWDYCEGVGLYWIYSGTLQLIPLTYL